MGVRVEEWVGRSLMAVRRLHFQTPVTADVAEGAVEFVWDDRSTVRVDAQLGQLVVTSRPWRDPFRAEHDCVPTEEVARVGRWVRHDVSRAAPFDRLIGQALTCASADSSMVVLGFEDSRVEVALPGADPVVTVFHPAQHLEWSLVEWRHDNAHEPVELYYELVDLWGRRKVEVWRDGRRGASSAFVELGGSIRATEALPPLIEINADPQFRGQQISAERFDAEWQATLHGIPTTTLWRPTGPTELGRVEASVWRRWPPRLPDQLIFYPVTTREYAERIAREWNVPASGVAYVTRFEVVREFMDRYAVQKAGGSGLTEWWVPTEELEDLNDHIVGTIEVVAEVRR